MMSIPDTYRPLRNSAGRKSMVGESAVGESAVRRNTVRRNTARRRRGTIMLQTIVVVAITSILIGIMGVMLHSLVRAHRTLENRRSDQLAIHQLAVQFREDIHGAEDVQTKDGLIIENKNAESIRYSADEATVTRVETVEDRVVQRELWRIQSLGELKFEIQEGLVPIVSLRIGKDQGLEFRIDAAQGITATEGGESNASQ